MFFILMAVELNILVQINIGESSSLSSSPRLVVDEDEISLRGNFLVWMMIRLRDRDLP